MFQGSIAIFFEIDPNHLLYNIFLYGADIRKEPGCQGGIEKVSDQRNPGWFITHDKSMDKWYIYRSMNA